MEQREIKFRQYLGKGKWHYWGFTELGGFTSPVQIDKIPSQQYIGLKDKNGKEIYEGDIVKGVNEFFGKMKGIVEFNEYMFMLEEKDKERGSSLSSLSNNPELEVIGNIYENPELLK